MKCFVLTKRKMLTICACCAICCLAVVFSVKGIQTVQTAYTQKVPVYSVPVPDKQVALTFDCAWDTDDTAHYMESLSEYGAQATFFVTGAWAEKYAQSVRALSRSGYEIGNLGNVYERLPQLSQTDIMDNLTKCSRTLRDMTGQTPALFRAPYGDYNALLLDTASALDMQTVQWDVNGLDRQSDGEKAVAEKIVREAKSGSIILLDNRSAFTYKALPHILQALAQEGYEIVSVSQLMRSASETRAA